MILRKVGAVSPEKDAYINSVTLLVNRSGTNGGQNNTFIDSSANNATVTRYGNVTQGAFTPYLDKYSTYFGSGNSLSVPYSSNLLLNASDCTVEGWFYLESAPANGDGNAQVFVCQGIGSYQYNQDDHNWLIFADGTNLYWGHNPTTATISISALPIRQWFHLACTMTSANVGKIYINNVQQVSTSSLTAISSSVSYSTVVGKFATGTTNGTYSYLTGYAFGVRVIKGTALTSFDLTAAPTAITNTQLLICKSNRFIDLSANNFTVAATGTPSIKHYNPFAPLSAYSTSSHGGSGYYDGTGDYITLPSTANYAVGSVFTVEAWIYPIGAPTGAPIIGGTVGSDFWDFSFNSSNTIRLHIVSGATLLTSNVPDAVILNTWNHVVLVRSGTGTNQTSIFLNGIRVANGTVTEAFTTSQNLQVGVLSGPYYTGYIGDVRVVKGTAVYDPSLTTLTVPTTPLTDITNTVLLLKYINAGIVDRSTNSVLETVGNAQISNGFVLLDGTGDYVISPTTIPGFGSGNFTVEVICTLTSLTAASFMFLSTRPIAGNSATSWGLGGDNTGQIFLYSNAYIVQSSAGAITTGTQYHIAVCRSGTSLKLFLNGTQVGTTATNSQVFGTSTICLGANLDGSETMNGTVIGRVTNYARYTINFTSPTYFPTI
jgi:hypothetical protein